MTNSPQMAVTVEQRDRDAAAAIVRWQRKATDEWQSKDGDAVMQFFVADFSRAILQGIWDEHPVVQAFARHRLQALAEPATGGDLREALHECVETLGRFVHSMATDDKHVKGRHAIQRGLRALSTAPSNPPDEVGQDSEARGTFACPICGWDKPHTHTKREIELHAKHPNGGWQCGLCGGRNDDCPRCGILPNGGYR